MLAVMHTRRRAPFALLRCPRARGGAAWQACNMPVLLSVLIFTGKNPPLVPTLLCMLIFTLRYAVLKGNPPSFMDS